MPQGLLDQYEKHNQFGKLIGMNFKILTLGKLEYRVRINEKHLATPKAAHGGLISALVDAALGVAALSAVASDKKVVSTVEFKLNFISPVFLNDELCAKAEVIQKGKRIVVSCCDVFCENRKNILIAKAIGTFNAYDAEKAGY